MSLGVPLRQGKAHARDLRFKFDRGDRRSFKPVYRQFESIFSQSPWIFKASRLSPSPKSLQFLLEAILSDHRGRKSSVSPFLPLRLTRDRHNTTVPAPFVCPRCFFPSLLGLPCAALLLINRAFFQHHSSPLLPSSPHSSNQLIIFTSEDLCPNGHPATQ